MTPPSGRSIPAIIALAALAALILSGCDLGQEPGDPTLAGGPQGGGGTQPCRAVFSGDQCDALLTAAAESLGVADEEVSSIDIVPEPTRPPNGVLMTRSGGPSIVMLAHVGDTVRPVQVCGGVSMEPPCKDSPAWDIASSIGAGYEDVPCAGEPPDGCPAPIPSLEPKAARTAQPLHVDHRVIPIADLGPHEVSLGTATIPNGVLTVAEGDLVDPWPDGVRLSSQGIRLEVRPLVAGRPAFNNIYEHGWWPGNEAVEVFLVFEVRHVEPGATIEIRDVEVR